MKIIYLLEMKFYKMTERIKLKYIKPTIFLNNNLIIVGSSSKLLNFDGEEIDRYKSVIRFNRAPTKKYEKFVGSKTTLRVMNNHTFDNFDLEDRFTGQPKSFIPDLRNENILRFLLENPKRDGKRIITKVQIIFSLITKKLIRSKKSLVTIHQN